MTRFINTLKKTKFESFYFECPPTQYADYAKNIPGFEFVLFKSNSLHLRSRIDFLPFQEHFYQNLDKIVSFKNLSGDATLIVPAPNQGYDQDCGHLADFVRYG